MIHSTSLTKRRSDGFVLLELMVVVAIIAILAAIAIATFLGQRAHAQDAAVESNMKNVLTSARSVAGNNHSEYPANVATAVNTSELSITVTAGASTADTQISLHYIDADSILLAGLSDSGTCWYVYDNIKSATYYGLDTDGDTNGCDASSANIGIDTSNFGVYHATTNEITGTDWNDATVVDPTS